MHARFGQENLQTDEEFVAKEIGHDTTRYDVDDLYTKCNPAERRILNRALFTRITINDEENAT